MDRTLSVVIPTTHRVDEVRALIDAIRASSPLRTRVTVVDNGPVASRRSWEHEDVVVANRYLGSEQAFITGLRAAPAATQYLLLDHDAVLREDTLTTLLGLPFRTDVVYSANHGGAGEMWDRVDGWSPVQRTKQEVLRPIRLAPWSGLLLPEAGRHIVLSQNSGYFFGWDDYLASWRIHSAGLQLRGVLGARLGNEDRGQEWLSSWRTYYQARNHVLFQRDTGLGSRSKLVELRAKLLVASVVAGAGERGLGIALGLIDGLRGRRGLVLLPGERPSSLLARRDGILRSSGKAAQRGRWIRAWRDQ